MKRAVFSTLWVGALATAIVIGLQQTGRLLRPETALAGWLGFAELPNESFGAGSFLLVLGLGLATAWTMSQVGELARRFSLLLLLLAELAGAAYLFSLGGIYFQPLPGIVVAIVATVIAAATGLSAGGRRRQEVARLFQGRLAPGAITRLTESDPDLTVPRTRDVALIFCEIANQADLIEELPPADCARLTNEFIAVAGEIFLKEGGYLHGTDGEGIRVVFGFPHASANPAVAAARAALLFRDRIAVLAYKKPESLGKIDLRIGVSFGPVVATVSEAAAVRDVVISGEPVELARRLAVANKIYGSQILLGPRAFSEAGAEIVARPIDFLRSSEAHERLEVYELIALTAEASAEEINCRDRFWTGLVYFRERRWNEAFAEFNRARRASVELDEPLQWYLHRLEPLILHMATEPAPVADPLAPL